MSICWKRRPDIRSAELAAAAQAQQIGIDHAKWYPHISITGALGYSTASVSQFFTCPAIHRKGRAFVPVEHP